MNNYYIYILASKRNGTLYIGVTNDLTRRIYEHRNKTIKGFTQKYNVDRLVHYEETIDVKEAIAREKLLKSWNRTWKLDLIEKTNPNWDNLYDKILGLDPRVKPEDDDSEQK